MGSRQERPTIYTLKTDSNGKNERYYIMERKLTELSETTHIANF